MEMNESEFVVAKLVNYSVRDLGVGPVLSFLVKFAFVYGRLLATWWKAKYWVLLVIFLSMVTPSIAEHANQNALTRIRREGFGPFEKDETIDTLINLVKTVVKEEERLVNATIEILKDGEKYMEVFLTGKARVIVWLIAIVVVLYLIRLVWPIIEFVWSLANWMVSRVFGFLKTLTCCMWCCSLTPFLKLRNWIKKRRLEREMSQVEVGNADELVSLSRHISEIEYDQYGPHLRSSFGEKIYFTRSQLDTNSFLALASAPSFERVKEERVKETILARSTPRPVSSLPSFQGYFTVDGYVVGHCSRISFKGVSCLLTAYHVLSYNRKADLILNANGKSVRFSDIKIGVMAFSKESDFDYIVLSVPDVIFSKLEMKKAKVAGHLTHGSPVMINQIIDGQKCYTIGLAQKADRPWTISYAASTVEGTSGAPILNVRHEVVGVHIEGGTQVNIGVVPELLRTMKESPQNGDINADDERAVPYDQDEDYEMTEEELEQRALEEAEHQEYLENRYLQYVTKGPEIMERTSNWAEIMDELDNDWWETHDDSNKKFDTFITRADVSGPHVGERIKGNRYRQKESPWTCSKCMTLHLKAGYNCKRCGFALKPSVKQVVDDKKAALIGKFPSVVECDLLKKLDDLSERYENLEKVVHRQLETYNDGKVKNLWYGDYEGHSRDITDKFPSKVSMEKKLATKLDQSPGFYTPMGEEGMRIKPQQSTIIRDKEGDFNQRTVTKEFPIEIEKVKARRRRNKRKQEAEVKLESNTLVNKESRKGKPSTSSVQKETKTFTEETPAVPLNSKSPSQDGGNTLTGVTSSILRKDPSKLECRALSSTQRVRHASLRIGEQPEK